MSEDPQVDPNSTVGCGSADAPGDHFDHPAADIVIRSSDGVDFKMLKVDLSRTSSVFEDTLSIPQPTEIDRTNPHKDGLPVIELSEARDVLDTLLRFCMPGHPPSLD